jgi:cellulose synthase/poly-beta-1,6-N-acetylglucosamine synthase-like glycosyltransferase
LLDVGTKPDNDGIVNLIRGFYAGDNIGGVTGLMSIDA